ncbi:SPL family radical SAM protein [Anaerolentibacter hominis]|uniref:SPL family radical SAM protein n=1 Tax=Anaerolentibacter hominis TaxID=3079009 RepID=UPI0031B80F34
MKASMGMKEIPAKTILSARKDGWFGTDYTMNLYRGCCHGCIYCDSRSECYGIDSFELVGKKENALYLLEQELRSRRKSGIVLTGSMSDPYNPFEKKEQLTRGALSLLAQYGYGVMIITKSDLALRDTDLLRSIAGQAPAVVQVTITTADEALCRRLEPHVSTTKERLEMIRKLSAEGITCGVLLMPLLPFVNDTEKNILELVERSAEAGARWVYGEYGFPVSLRDRQRDYLYARLDDLFPGMSARYRKAFGNGYWCSRIGDGTMEKFRLACEKAGLLCGMEEIKSCVRDLYGYRQLDLTNLPGMTIVKDEINE